MAKIRNEELAQLAGELLPERTVLSTVPMDGGPANIFQCKQDDQESQDYWSYINSVNNCGNDNKFEPQNGDTSSTLPIKIGL